MKAQAVLVFVLVGLAIAGCGITVDLSDMVYEKPDDIRSVADGKTDAGTDAGGQDQGSEDTRDPKEMTCWELFHCVWKEDQKCNDLLDPGCYQKCADGDWWKDVPEMWDLHECFVEKCASGAGYAFPDQADKCIEDLCILEYLDCVQYDEGEEQCYEAMACMTEDECRDENGPDDMDCIGECADGLTDAEFDIIRQLAVNCPQQGSRPGGETGEAPTADMSTKCMESMFECYSGGGDATCAQTAACTWGCDQGSPPTCYEDCLSEMSEESATEYLASTRCIYEPMTIPFDCLLPLTTCLKSLPEGKEPYKCNGVLAASPATLIYYAYYNELDPAWLAEMGLTPEQVTHKEKFMIMVNAVQNTMKDDWGKLQDLIACLKKEAETYGPMPGAPDIYGVLPKLKFEACEIKNTCKHQNVNPK